MDSRLLQANVRNDVAALEEVARLLGDLWTAWAGIAPAPETACADLHA